jgi:signal peptidase I
MLSALQVGDKLIIDKLGYHFKQPARGDIVVFNPTENLKRLGHNGAFINRVIGLPGEKVELKDGKVFINDQPLNETRYVIDNKQTRIEPCREPNVYLMSPVTLPKDAYLTLGDNRDNSFDGRCWGSVPRKNLIGQAAFRYWPPNRNGKI